MRPQRILAVSPVTAYEGHNTSIHRIRALRELGHNVTVVDSTAPGIPIGWRLRNKMFRLGLPIAIGDPPKVRPRLLEQTSMKNWGIIWLEKALSVDRRTVREVRKLVPDALVVGYSPDDMNARHNQSREFLSALPLYDYFVTTKSYNVPELRALGCANAIFIGNAYDPEVFHPVPITDADRHRLGGEIGFIGSFEEARARSLQRLAQVGFQVRIWGGGWKNFASRTPNLRVERLPLFGDDYARACAAFKINLCFLRKMNRDQQTTRSVELPACGGFMMAERTEEHAALFEEGLEAEFFSSDEELIDKCRHYLADEAARTRVAQAGLERCLRSGYDNRGRLQLALNEIERLQRSSVSSVGSADAEAIR